MNELAHEWRYRWGEAQDGTTYEAWLERRAVAMHDALQAWKRAWAEQGEAKVRLMVAAADATERALAALESASGKRGPAEVSPCCPTSGPPAGPP